MEAQDTFAGVPAVTTFAHPQDRLQDAGAAMKERTRPSMDFRDDPDPQYMYSMHDEAPGTWGDTFNFHADGDGKKVGGTFIVLDFGNPDHPASSRGVLRPTVVPHLPIGFRSQRRIITKKADGSKGPTKSVIFSVGFLKNAKVPAYTASIEGKVSPIGPFERGKSGRLLTCGEVTSRVWSALGS